MYVEYQCGRRTAVLRPTVNSREKAKPNSEPYMCIYLCLESPHPKALYGYL